MGVSSQNVECATNRYHPGMWSVATHPGMWNVKSIRYHPGMWNVATHPGMWNVERWPHSIFRDE